MLLQCQGSLIRAFYHAALSAAALNEHLLILCVLNLLYINGAVRNLEL